MTDDLADEIQAQQLKGLSEREKFEIRFANLPQAEWERAKALLISEGEASKAKAEAKAVPVDRRSDEAKRIQGLDDDALADEREKYGLTNDRGLTLSTAMTRFRRQVSRG
jgi:hypothetical protein